MYMLYLFRPITLEWVNDLARLYNLCQGHLAQQPISKHNTDIPTTDPWYTTSLFSMNYSINGALGNPSRKHSPCGHCLDLPTRHCTFPRHKLMSCHWEMALHEQMQHFEHTVFGVGNFCTATAHFYKSVHWRYWKMSLMWLSPQALNYVRTSLVGT